MSDYTVAERLREARSQGRPALIHEDQLPGDAGAAYRMALWPDRAVAAWKIGGANPWSMEVFGNTEPFFGALYPHEVFVDSPEVPVSGLHAPLAEPELALELAAWPPTAGAPLFSRMGPAVEFPATVLPEPIKPLLTGQILDRAGAGALWIGEAVPFDGAALVTPFETRFAKNTDAAATGSSGDVLGQPLGAALSFLGLALRHGMPLAGGQWIATGGTSRAVPVAAGDRLQVGMLGQSAYLQLH